MNKDERGRQPRGRRSVRAGARNRSGPRILPRSKILWGAGIAAVALLSVALATAFWSAPPSGQLLEEAQQALRNKDYSAVERLSQRVLQKAPRSPEALLLAGEAATKLERYHAALAYYEQMPSDGGKQSALGYACAGEILLHLHHASEAEAQYRRALALDPRQLLAHKRLGYLLGIEGRRWESVPHLFEVLRGGQFTFEDLLLLGNPASVIEMSEELEQFQQAAPDDPLPLLGFARIALRRNDLKEARQILEKVLAARPGQLEALAEFGQVLVSTADPGLSRWLAQLPADAEKHPDIWVTRGLWCKQHGDTRGAARCFWEALARDPNHQAATFQLSQMLEVIGEPALAQQLGERAGRLQKRSDTMELLFSSRRNLQWLRAAVQLTESVGCLWEAWGWQQIILSMNPHDDAAQRSLKRLQSQLDERTPLVLDAANPSKAIDLSYLPVPDWKSASGENQVRSAPTAAEATVAFIDSTEASGIRFQYFAGRDRFEEGRRIFQITGGGAGVLDYDGDGWPDIYLAQGSDWPPEARKIDRLDCLYRNVGGGRFEETTGVSCLFEDSFSQGLAVGDFNCDGFPDLYIANIGANRLFANQGDGTFRDASAEAGLLAEQWTTSCVLADFNGDGLPDIYDVNYVQGDDVFTKMCGSNGTNRSCAPTVFEAQPDRFYLNSGDGRFEDQTQAAGFARSGGNGMGALAADFDGSGRLNLFVSNDQDANFYFVNATPHVGAPPAFHEQGIASGLAYDGNGKALACMGIAAGDANGDGKLDLFVTNFFQESNTLYLQQSPTLFFDSTNESGLRTPSFEMLGFGAQFLDGELDGYPDLVLANGHIDDFSQQGLPYEMLPQYFRNLGGGHFEELSAGRLGDFFARKQLGRALARLDWNRDGREDFVVSHLSSPAALITNATSQAGHYLALQLRGISSSRDAIGAIVTLETGGRVYRQWLTAGDGFQASNQRQLVFGLGTQTAVDKLAIHWPSGNEQSFANLAADQQLIVVEKSPRLTRLPIEY